ncbi:carboxymuconolactone decarboxylase family protein [Bosea sp. BH3]|uniref:carboxymuconolactone decarboxylase family protein n=1 Tax=Bosea sp. BH3 TaxID=2871701 RepID=UPI0021CB275B|nr:carboxymuconolactone decarboxylase family protein [Bosea sp. BH3]MCU4178897.1 carboxymuconolactone decarboxylase family protein [Bosea sp. BH3]
MTIRPEFEGEQFKKGLAIRREVLGPAYVDKSVQGATDMTAPLQKLVTEWCWGEVWGRPGLDRRTRSFLNLAFLTALNRPNEIKLHVRGAINNGLKPEEIQEVILQAAIYCGVPAALDCMKVVVETLKDIEEGR